MKHIAGWFRRNNTLMAQAKDLARQLQEAWDDAAEKEVAFNEVMKQLSEQQSEDFVTQDNAEKAVENLTAQLHRVARERDEERRLRLEAEDRLLDRYLDDEPAALKRENEALEARLSKYLSDWGMGPAPLLSKIDELRRELTSLKAAYYRANLRRWKLEEEAELAQAAEELRDTYLEEE